MNGRVLAAPLTGVQRYATELLARLECHVDTIAAPAAARGWPGHLWEQLVLPRRVRGRLLWSPANSGPVQVEQQVLTVHDTLPLDRPDWVGPMYGRWYRRIVPRVVKRARAVIVDSSFVRDRVLHYCDVDPARLHVIPLGASEQFAPASAAELAAMRRALRIPDGPYVLTLGTFDQRRNLATLFRAWNRVAAKQGSATLVLAGERGHRRVIGGAVEAVPAAALRPGRIPEALLPALYSGASAFVFMSRYEGFGLPLIEAMACGTPVIAARASALPETVGDGGIMVEPDDAASLATELDRLLSDDAYRAHWVRAGLRRAGGLTWDACAAGTWAVLRAAAASSAD